MTTTKKPSSVTTRDVDGRSTRRYATLAGAAKRFEEMSGRTLEEALMERFDLLDQPLRVGQQAAVEGAAFIRTVSDFGCVVAYECDPEVARAARERLAAEQAALDKAKAEHDARCAEQAEADYLADFKGKSSTRAWRLLPAPAPAAKAPAVEFFIGGSSEGPVCLADLLAANADDPDLCEWARTAQPGDRYPDGEGCECRAQLDMTPEGLHAALTRATTRERLVQLHEQLLGYCPPTDLPEADLRRAVASYIDQLVIEADELAAAEACPEDDTDYCIEATGATDPGYVCPVSGDVRRVMDRAQEHAKRPENAGRSVRVTYRRKSDGVRGYLNPDGQHASSGQPYPRA